MPEIVLIRHGKPACDDRTPIPGTDFARWMRDYDDAGLDATLAPPEGLRAHAAAMGCIATSTLKRSRESAQLLVPGRSVTGDPLFVEAEIPSRFSVRLSLAPRSWSVLARAGWFCGWSDGVESWREARGRARRAAERLGELARQRGSVMLVGHGMMNRLISQVLRRQGWRGPPSGFSLWSVTALERGSS
jgi:broad specificity phosphatase PhoE